MQNFQYELSLPLYTNQYQCSNNGSKNNMSSQDIQQNKSKSYQIYQLKQLNSQSNQLHQEQFQDQTQIKGKRIIIQNQNLQSHDIEQQNPYIVNDSTYSQNLNTSINQVFENQNKISEQTQQDSDFVQCFQCQIIRPNEQIDNHVKIFYMSCMLNKNFKDIFGEYHENDEYLNQEDFKYQDIGQEIYQQEQNSEQQKQKMTIQNIYQVKNIVSVKTVISEKYKQFIIQKTIYQNTKQNLESFTQMVNQETQILRYLQQKGRQITVPFIQSQIYQIEGSQLHACHIQMFSGIKSLQQIKQQYQISQKFEEYIILLQFAFNQLLLKLNEMHHIYKIAHSDIKPQNIIIGYDYNFYFIDFGASIYLENQSSRQEYLSSYTPYYNLEKDITKRNDPSTSWTKQKIIDCDTMQLILSFLYMLDFERKGYENLKETGKTEKFKSNLKPEFKEFGDFLTKMFSFLVQKEQNKYVPVPQQQIFLISNLENLFENMMSSQQDVLYNEQTKQYELKFINQFSIQIIELIIKNHPQASFYTNQETLVEEYLNFDKNNTKASIYEQRSLNRFPLFCQTFEITQPNILFLALTRYKFNQKPLFINKILKEYSKPITQIEYESEIIYKTLELDHSKCIFLNLTEFENQNLISLETKQLQKDSSAQALTIDLKLNQNEEILKILKYLQKQVIRHEYLTRLVISFDQKIIQDNFSHLRDLNKNCLGSQVQLLIQIIITNYINFLQEYLDLIKNEKELNIILHIKDEFCEIQNINKIIENQQIQNSVSLILFKLNDNQKIENLQVDLKKYQLIQNVEQNYFIFKNLLFCQFFEDEIIDDFISYEFKSPVDDYKINKEQKEDSVDQQVQEKIQTLLKRNYKPKKFYLFKLSFAQNYQSYQIDYSKDLFQKICIFNKKKEYFINDFKKVVCYTICKSLKNIFSQYEFESYIKYINRQYLWVDLINFNKISKLQLQMIADLIKDNCSGSQSNLIRFQKNKICIQEVEDILTQIMSYKSFKTSKFQLEFIQIEFQRLSQIQKLLSILQTKNINYEMNLKNCTLKEQIDIDHIEFQIHTKNWFYHYLTKSVKITNLSLRDNQLNLSITYCFRHPSVMIDNTNLNFDKIQIESQEYEIQKNSIQLIEFLPIQDKNIINFVFMAILVGLIGVFYYYCFSIKIKDFLILWSANNFIKFIALIKTFCRCVNTKFYTLSFFKELELLYSDAKIKVSFYLLLEILFPIIYFANTFDGKWELEEKADVIVPFLVLKTFINISSIILVKPLILQFFIKIQVINKKIMMLKKINYIYLLIHLLNEGVIILRLIINFVL